ncbi:hypothetical protein JW968_02745 [Candidatus Woesearchaeota archaeon]|nr:hypothetical protein [Candidatus Woesearchaeota archaeon]
MKIQEIFSVKRIAFLGLFIAVVFVANRLNFSSVIGSEAQYFTLFQFFGPIAGAFLGPVFGAISVLGAQIADYLIFGKAFTLINMIRLTPMVFAAIYFGSKRRYIGIAVPLVCMALFIANPTGRAAWLYAMFWWIPVIVKILPKRYSDNLLLKSLGSTFTAHAVGSAAWMYAVPMAPEQWLMLIPVVVIERLAFTLGITGSYVVFNVVLDKMKASFRVPQDVLSIDRRYTISYLLKS